MTHLRLLADDLTGALDSAAAFVPLAGPVSVTWHAVAAQRSVAFDCGTRDLPAEQACESMERFSHLLDDGAPAFKKIDSLLRGHVALELAVCMRRFDHCVLAPAFPFQGRITRNGRQLIHSGGGWRDTGVDLSAELRALGVAARMLDAGTDADLDSIRGLPAFAETMKMGHADRRYAAVWSSDARFEASSLYGLDPAGHDAQGRTLISQGYRPVSVSVTRTWKGMS